MPGVRPTLLSMVSQPPLRLVPTHRMEPRLSARATRSLLLLVGRAEATLKAASAVRTEMSCMVNEWKVDEIE